MVDEEEWDLVALPGGGAGSDVPKPRDVGAALEAGDTAAARLGSARRLNAVLEAFELQRKVDGQMSTADLKAIIAGHAALGSMLGDAIRTPGVVEVEKKEDPFAALTRAVSTTSKRAKVKLLPPVAMPEPAEEAEFVVDDVIPNYGNMGWCGARLAAVPYLQTVLEMIRHGATATMIVQIYPDLRTSDIGDLRAKWRRKFGTNPTPPSWERRNAGGWYGGPHARELPGCKSTLR